MSEREHIKTFVIENHKGIKKPKNIFMKNDNNKLLRKFAVQRSRNDIYDAKANDRC